jgi:6-pyruvoyltetrahydropterin/6-carboxytetrahydropterin synthase
MNQSSQPPFVPFDPTPPTGPGASASAAQGNNNPHYHGHNYNLEVKVTGEIDPETGYVIDTKKLAALIRSEIEDKFDHRNLNLDTIEFKELNPTAEHIAIVIWEKLRAKIDSRFELGIRLFETERNYVEYNG